MSVVRVTLVVQRWLGNSARPYSIILIAFLGLLAVPAATLADQRIYVPWVVRSGGTVSTPSWSAPIAISPVDGAIWVVNPDANTVTAVDAQQFTVVTEIPVGVEPWALAIAPDGMVAVINRGSGTLSLIDPVQHVVRTTIPLGPEPTGIALSPRGTFAYITLTTADTVVVVDTTRATVVQTIAVAPRPAAIAISTNGNRDDDDAQVYVTHAFALPRAGGAETTDDGRVGAITMFPTRQPTLTQTITLAPDAHGFPNLLMGIALTARYAWVPQVRAAPALPNGLTTTVFAAVSAIDRTTNREDATAALPLNDQDIFGSPVNNPVAAVPSPDENTLYIVLAGSDLVEVVDVHTPQQPRLIKFLPTGKNPRGIAISADGRRGYVMSYLSRAVTVLDLHQLMTIGTVTVTSETLDPVVLRGKILFNTATNPQVSRLSWMSCASCHVDGGTDNVTWMFPDGPRQTPPLWNAGQTLPWHWSAALDEPQDVEFTIQEIQQGLGLAPGADPPLLGAPDAGRSADLDALAAYLTRGIRTPNLPLVVDSVARGRALFVQAGCAACHGGPNWTTSTLPSAPGTLDSDGNGMVDPMLHNVGTVDPRDVHGATGFDVPSLLNVGLTAPYLHSGALRTLDAVLDSGHPNPQGGTTFSTDDKAALLTFLHSLGPTTPPISGQ